MIAEETSLSDQFVERYGLYAIRYREALLSWIDYGNTFQVEVVQGDPYGRRQSRRIFTLALHAEQLVTATQHQVDFRSLMRGPECRLVVLFVDENLLDGKAFPRRTELRMTLDRPGRVDPKQLVQQTTVADVNLG